MGCSCLRAHDCDTSPKYFRKEPANQSAIYLLPAVGFGLLITVFQIEVAARE